MNLIIFSLFLILINLNKSIDAFYYNDSAFIESIKLDYNYKEYYNPFYNRTIDYLNFLSNNKEINNQCKSSIKRWINGLQSNEIWALKFLESTGKTINGKLTGRNINFGSFDACIEFTRNLDQNIDFDGKYCLISLHSKETEIIKSLDNYKKAQNLLSERSKYLVNFNIGNAHGVCMPSTCSINEITSITNKLLAKHGLSILPPKKCTTISEPEAFTTLQLISYLILSAFIFLSILSLFIKNDFINNFSIVDNYNAIYYYDQKDEQPDRSFLHGVKFLLIIVSITLHVMTILGFFFAQPYGTVKEINFSPAIKSFLSRTYLFADNMFILGGFFSMYAWYDVIKENKIKYNFFNFFALRYFKVAIICFIIILIHFILPTLGNGPLFSDLTNHFYHNCKENYWNVFLLISNEQRSLEMCIIPSWYLAADFQIYILNFFVIYYLVKKPKLGFLIAFIQSFIISIFSLLFIKYNNVKTIFNAFDLYIYDGSEFEDLYFHFFYHYNTYLLGMICAWLIKNKIKPKILDFKSIRTIISIIAFSSFYLLLKYLDYLELNKIKQNEYLNFFWPVIDKLINSLMPFWIFYSILNGYLAPFKKISSFRFYVPWSRLSFSLITVQFIYLIYSLGSTRSVFPYNRMSSIKELFSAYLFTFLLGNFIFIFFENPMQNLLKSYLGLKKRSEIHMTSDSNKNEIKNEIKKKL